MTIPSGGFLRSGEAAKVDTATRSVIGSLDDGTVWQVKNGSTWSANGTKLTTSTARASNPRIIFFEEYSDFNFQADVGFGDAIYFPYQDESTWIRVVHWCTYQQSCSTCYSTCYQTCYSTCYDTCYSQCPTTCYQTCTGTNYAPQYINNRNCYGGGNYFYAQGAAYCGTCSGDYAGNCPAGYYAVSNYCLYTGTQCITGYYDYQCNPYTCYYTCNPYQCNPYQCSPYSCNPYQCNPYTCNCVDLYPSYIRLEKMVGGVLSTVGTDVTLNGNTSTNLGYIRVTGKGSAINVYSSQSPSTAHITQTVTDMQFAKGYGVGRHGYGNQDSAPELDNISCQVF